MNWIQPVFHFARSGDLRQHLEDSLEFVLMQGHQAGFDGHGSCRAAGGPAAANSGCGVCPAARILACFGANLSGIACLAGDAYAGFGTT